MSQLEIPQREEFRFTREQLDNLLTGTVEMFLEYRDRHGYEEQKAGPAAVRELIEGLDAEADLAEWGEGKATMQTLPSPLEEAAPELLEACKAARSYLGEHIESTRDQAIQSTCEPGDASVYGVCNKAIAKAISSPARHGVEQAPAATETRSDSGEFDSERELTQSRRGAELSR